MAKISFIQIIVKLISILPSKALLLFPPTAMPALWGLPPLAMRDGRLIGERRLIGTHTHSQTLTPLNLRLTVVGAPSFAECNVLKLVDSRGPAAVEITVSVKLITVCGNLPLKGVGIIPPCPISL